MKKLLTTSLFVALVALFGVQTPAQAQIGLSAHVGLDLDLEELYIGGDLVFPVNIGENEFIGNPSIDLYPFLDGNISLFTLNLDLLYELLEVAEQYPLRVGAGLGFQRWSYDIADLPGEIDDSDVDLLLNLIGEVLWLRENSRLTPYGRLRLAVGKGTGLALIAGVRVSLGGN